MGVRPTYEETVKPYLSKIISWRRDGAKIAWIIEQFPIHTSTFYVWRKEHKELEEALKNSVEQFYDDLVVTAENSLIEKLIDRMMVVEKTSEVWIDANGKVRGEHIVEKKKLVLADTTAIIFALKSHKPLKWNNSEHELSLARIEKIKAEIARLDKGEDIGSLIMQSLNKYIGDGSE